MNSVNLKNVDSLKPKLSNSIISYDFVVNPLESNLQEILNTSSLKSEGDYQKVDYSEYDFKVSNTDGSELLEHKILLETCNKYTILLFPNTMNASSIEFILLTGISLISELCIL